MNKYKSILTYEKIKAIKTPQIDIQFSSYTEIDSKFKDFREKYRQKEFQNDKILQKQKTLIQPNEKQHLGEVVPMDTNFKNQLSKNKKGNPVVEMFGNVLIATVFQSLIIKMIENLYKVHINIESEIPVSTAVLKAFDISTIVLNSFNTHEEKKLYLANQMNEKIDGLLKNWSEKVEQKEKKQQELDQEELKKKQSNKKNEFYSWLNVNTNSEALKSKLRNQIAEQINDYENMLIVQDVIEKRKDNPKNKNLRAEINILKKTSTKDIFLNMNKYGNFKIKQYLTRLGLTQQQNVVETQKEPDETLTPEQIAQMSEQELLMNPQTSKNFQFWDKNKEKQFKATIHSKKYLFSNETSSSSWSQIAFMPFVQKFMMDMKMKMQREHLLDKYMDGEGLTREELKFMTNTSELLNSCIDKKSIQGALNIIDKDIISNMELGLAEDILTQYEEIQKAIKASRQQYIDQSNNLHYMKQKEYDQKILKQKQQEKNIRYMQRFKNMVNYITHKMSREGKFHETPPKHLKGADQVYKYLQGNMSAQQLLKEIKELNIFIEDSDEQIQKRKELEDKEKRDKKEKTDYYRRISKPNNQQWGKDFIVNLKKHHYHPSSKIFIQSTGEVEVEDEEETTVAKQNVKKEIQAIKHKIQKESDQFKLNLKSSYFLKNPVKFQVFYSGGPAEKPRDEPFYNPLSPSEMKATPQELKQIIMIQKCFRAHRLMKQIREDLENKQKEKYDRYKYKIEQLKLMNNIKVSVEGNTNTINDLKIRFKQGNDSDSGGEEKSQDNKRVEMNLNKSSSNHDMHNHFLSNYNNLQGPSPNQVSMYTSETKLRPQTSLMGVSQKLHSPQSKDLHNIQSTYFTQASTNMNSELSEQFEDKMNKQKFHIKQQKLFEAAHKNKFWILSTSGFTFSAKEINSVDKRGNSILHVTVQKGNLEFTQWIIENGGDVNAKNNNGETPVHLAFKTNKLQIIMLVINNRGDLNALNHNYETPVAFASTKIIKLLNLQHATLKCETSTIEFDNNQFIRFGTADLINQSITKSKTALTSQKSNYQQSIMKVKSVMLDSVKMSTEQ